MSKTELVQIKRGSLELILKILEAQSSTFSEPNFIKKVPIVKRPLFKLNVKLLKNQVKEIKGILE